MFIDPYSLLSSHSAVNLTSPPAVQVMGLMINHTIPSLPPVPPTYPSPGRTIFSRAQNLLSIFCYLLPFSGFQVLVCSGTLVTAVCSVADAWLYLFPGSYANAGWAPQHIPMKPCSPESFQRAEKKLCFCCLAGLMKEQDSWSRMARRCGVAAPAATCVSVMVGW